MDTPLSTKIAITFPIRLIDRLKDKANFEYGFDIPNMIRKLVSDYVDDPVETTEYLTHQQEARYLRDIEETLALRDEGRVKAAYSAKELQKQIEEEDLSDQ
jgi:hypothetical protein